MEQLEKLPRLVPHLQPGVLGSQIWKNESIIDANCFEYINGRPITSGEAGTAYAHFTVYNLIVLSGWNWALVLEDNARLRDGADDYIKNLIDSIEHDKNFAYCPIVVHLNHENAKFISSRIVFNSGMQVYEPFTLLRTTKAYLINLSAAKIALSDGLPLKDVADWPHWIHNVKFFASVQDLVEIDRSSGSEIGARPKGKYDIEIKYKSKIFRKAQTLVSFLIGLEALNYRRKTGLNDYFAWIVMDRFFRLNGKWLGKPDLENSSVLILQARIFKIIRQRINQRQLMKGTSKF